METFLSNTSLNAHLLDACKNDTIAESILERLRMMQYRLSDFNITIDNIQQIFIAAIQAPFLDDAWLRCCIATLYIIIFVIGTIGNVVVAFIIICVSHLHTNTNCFLCSLAISDTLLVLIGVPNDIYFIWYPRQAGIDSRWFCVLKSTILEICTNASVLSIVGVSWERFMAICHPLHHRLFCSRNRMIKYIITIWTFSSILALHFGIQYRIVKQEHVICNTSVFTDSSCSFTDEIFQHSIEMHFMFIFCIPLCLVLYFYARILRNLQNSPQKRQFAKRNSESSQSSLSLNQPSSVLESIMEQAQHMIVQMLSKIFSRLTFRTAVLVYISQEDFIHLTHINIRLFNPVSNFFLLFSYGSYSLLHLLSAVSSATYLHEL